MVTKFNVKPVEASKENFNNVINLITRAWKYDYGNEGFLQYDRDYFEWLYQAPEFNPQLANGIYTREGKLIGFNGVVPAKLNWKSKVILMLYLRLQQ